MSRSVKTITTRRRNRIKKRRRGLVWGEYNQDKYRWSNIDKAKRREEEDHNKVKRQVKYNINKYKERKTTTGRIIVISTRKIIENKTIEIGGQNEENKNSPVVANQLWLRKVEEGWYEENKPWKIVIRRRSSWLWQVEAKFWLKIIKVRVWSSVKDHSGDKNMSENNYECVGIYSSFSGSPPMASIVKFSAPSSSFSPISERVNY